MPTYEPTVFIVDDDPAVRDSLHLLLRSVGMAGETYCSGEEFLAAYDPNRPGCVLLDVRMPGMSGLELQQRLSSLQSHLPVVFLTAHGDVPMAVEAVQEGALDFVQKPFRDQDLIDRVQRAIAQDDARRERFLARKEIADRLASLSRREREVMRLVVDGKANRVVARELGISQRTVEIHRANVMRKMQATSVSHLVRMALQSVSFGPSPVPPRARSGSV